MGVGGGGVCNNDLLKHATQFTENVTELKSESTGTKNSLYQCLALWLVHAHAALSAVVSLFIFSHVHLACLNAAMHSNLKLKCKNLVRAAALHGPSGAPGPSLMHRLS